MSAARRQPGDPRLFASADANDDWPYFAVIRPALRRSKLSRKKFGQGRTSLEMVGHAYRFHGRKLA